MNVDLSWTFGPVSSRQRPVVKTVIEARVAASLPFVVIAEVAFPGTTTVHENADPGDWEYRAFPVDDRGVAALPKTATASVAFDAPSELATFSATPT